MDTLQFFAESSTYYRSSDASDAAAAAFVGVVLMFSVFIALLGYIVNSYLLSRVFKKAEIESWKAWVPIYSSWIMLEMGGQRGFWAIILLIPMVNIIALVFLIIAMYNIGLKFGKEGAFVLLAIFLPIVWVAWLAFDKSTWNKKLKLQETV